MTPKTCFKCLRTLDLSDFYKHPRMGDGHLGKCKDCTKTDTEIRRKDLEAYDLQWVLAERERHRIKSSKRRKLQPAPSKEQNAKRIQNYQNKYPVKKIATSKVGHAIRDGKLTRKPCEVCGKEKAQAHHDDYSKPLDVRWLCVKHHNEHHVAQRNAAVVAKFTPLNTP